MRIMYVEDNLVNLELVRRIARLGNHEVVSFAGGAEALAALETEPIDLILMDIELEGELDGIEVVKRLRARGDQRPIVAITAYAMAGDEERILAAGCNNYLPKPLPISQFLTLVAKYDPANVQPQPSSEVAPLTVPLAAPAPVMTAAVTVPPSTAPVNGQVQPVAAPAPATLPAPAVVSTPAATSPTPSPTNTAPASLAPEKLPEKSDDDPAAELTVTRPPVPISHAYVAPVAPVSSQPDQPMKESRDERPA